MGRRGHSILCLDQTLTGHCSQAQTQILLERNLPRKQFRQLRETRPRSGPVWSASTGVSHKSPPECGITWREQSIQSRDATALLLTLGPEPTQAAGQRDQPCFGCLLAASCKCKVMTLCSSSSFKCPNFFKDRRCLHLGALGSKMDVGVSRVKLWWPVGF